MFRNVLKCSNGRVNKAAEMSATKPKTRKRVVSHTGKTPLTIYPTNELKSALAVLAKECDRDLSSQCVAMLKQCVGNTKN